MTRPTQTRAGNFVHYARISVPVTRPARALAVGASLAFHE
jgi:hypothetical protein